MQNHSWADRDLNLVELELVAGGNDYGTEDGNADATTQMFDDGSTYDASTGAATEAPDDTPGDGPEEARARHPQPVFPDRGDERFLDSPLQMTPNDELMLRAIRNNPGLIAPEYQRFFGSHFRPAIDGFLRDYRQGRDSVFPEGPPNEPGTLPPYPWNSVELQG